MDEQVHLKSLLLLCKRRFVTILLTCSLVIILTSLLNIYVLQPKFEYSKQIMVGQLAFENESNNYAISTANVQLIRSYMDFIKSSIVLDSILQELELNRSATALSEQITIRNNEHSQIVTITVSDTDSVLAKQIADLVTFRSIEVMSNFTNSNHFRILEQTTHSGKPQQVFPTPLLFIILSAFFGLFTGLCLAILKDGFDTTIKNEKETESLGVPLLGSLGTKAWRLMRKYPIGVRGDLIEGNIKKRNTVESITDQIDETVLNLQHSMSNSKIVLFTSVRDVPEYPYISSEVAATFARKGKKVLLIDANFYSPLLHSIFQVSNGFGIATLLSEESVEMGPLLSPVENLSFLPSGPAPKWDSKWVLQDKMNKHLERWWDEYDYIFLITPPILEKADIKILATSSDGILIFLRRNKTKREEAIQSIAEMKKGREKVIGTFFIS